MTPDTEMSETPTPGRALDEISPARQAFNRHVSGVVDAVASFMSLHWLAVLNTVLTVFIGIAFLAPIGYSLGFVGPSSRVFEVYRYVCGQTPSHSFFVAGYQVCLCSRCLAIYSSLLVCGLLLAMFRYRANIRAIGWKWWLLGMVPMALDGGTQAVGWHESNVYLRLLTGAIFGIMTAWFVLPQIEEPTVAENLAAMHRVRR